MSRAESRTLDGGDRLVDERNPHLELKAHLTWQEGRMNALKCNIERLYNEWQWLKTKTSETEQDGVLLGRDLQQANKAARELKKEIESMSLKLDLIDREAQLETSSSAALTELCDKGSAALAESARERHLRKAEEKELRAKAVRAESAYEQMANRLRKSVLPS